ncbi:zinc finger protein 26-like [Antennarius striatus]|uniref:zinc finger protein 26-like n=1 Tax=Antennarius striatus TaxID=241820 RepID=UPI0035B3547D
MFSLKDYLTDRLTAAAEEIFEVVKKTMAEYKEEISRSKDLEISRLRIQLRLLKSDTRFDTCFGGGPPQQEIHHHHPPPPVQRIHHPPFPAADAPDSEHCKEDGCSTMEQEHPEPSEVKKEQQKSHFWMDPDESQLDSLDSDIKDFISPASSQRDNLQDPIMVFHHSNTGEENKDRPYCCSVCEKRFGNCSHLAAHIRTHTGERPYRCEICKKFFITTSALNRHQTIHTEGKQYVCNVCGKSFKWMDSLRRHVICVHKGANDTTVIQRPPGDSNLPGVGT